MTNSDPRFSAANASDVCKDCRLERREHHIDGAAYGLCGQFSDVAHAPAQAVGMTDAQRDALERMAGHDPNKPGLSYDSLDQLVSSAAQAAKDVLIALAAQPPAAPVETDQIDGDALLAAPVEHCHCPDNVCEHFADGSCRRAPERCSAGNVEVRCDGCGSPWTSADLAKAKAEDPKIISCCPERKPLDIDAWMTRALDAERKLRALNEPQHVQVTEEMLAAGAQALADDVWHPPQKFSSLPAHDQNRFTRHALLVLKAATAPLTRPHGGRE